MSKLFGGSLCFTEIMEKAKAGHSAFSRAKNGKVYFNINVWLNDEPDRLGNEISVQLNSKKENREAEGKIYIGNAKAVVAQASVPLTASNDEEFSDDLPF